MLNSPQDARSLCKELKLILFCYYLLLLFMNMYENFSSQNYNWENNWKALNWYRINCRVFDMQKSIFYSIKDNDIGAARNMQFALINDFSAKLLAVKKVTQDSSGKKTPGTDRRLALTEEDRFKLANELCLDGNADYIRRVYIPKAGSKEFRPLGIPTIFDRAKQALCKFALEPEFEAKFESNSFGFRPGRSQLDAVLKIRSHLMFEGPCYVLDADIKKCFDKINHQVLVNRINNIPIINQQIHSWLKTGIFEQNEIIFPNQGTPQGGLISPLLANIVLDGIQQAISDGIYHKFGSVAMKQAYFVRYADDFVLMHPREDVFLLAKSIVEMKLAEIHLELKLEKTRTLNTLELITENGKTRAKSSHFDFLGFRFKQRYVTRHLKWKSFNDNASPIRTYVLVAPDRIIRHKASISARLKVINSVKFLIEDLNPRITGWCNYFRHSDSKIYGDLPRKMDLWINSKIRKWIRKNTKLRGKTDKFWKKGDKDWILRYVNKEGEEISLVKYTSFTWSILQCRAMETSTSIYMLTYDQFISKTNDIQDRQLS